MRRNAKMKRVFAAERFAAAMFEKLRAWLRLIYLISALLSQNINLWNWTMTKSGATRAT
jgi:hypothetical protein